MKTTTTKRGARVTKAGNVIGMTKAYAVVVLREGATKPSITETNDLGDATSLAKVMAKTGATAEIHSSGGLMMSFKKEEK